MNPGAFRPTEHDGMRFKLYEWVVKSVLEENLWKKCRSDEICQICVSLGNLFEDKVNEMKSADVEQLYKQIFGEGVSDEQNKGNVGD